MYSVKEGLKDRSILITGCTGFVGKALFEKIIRDVPSVRKIFLLIRGNAKERFMEEVYTSKIFDQYKSMHNDFEQVMREKVVPVTGDVQKDMLGLTPESLRMLQEQVNIVVHCAATVDFKERLDSAIRQNVIGTLQLFETAKSFHRLDAFVHVSTAYVNCDREGEHKETLPPITFDPEEMVQLILQMNPEEIEKATPGIIGSYPNTYTFTKAIAEKLLERRRGNTPIALVRPTIIGAAFREPKPGWIDSVSAVAAAILYSGVGVVHFLQGDHQVVADIVPIDIVVNVILGAIAHTVARPDQLRIYHAGTSKVNPVRWYEVARWVSVYWRHHNVQKRVDSTPLHFRFYKSNLTYKANHFVRHELPTAMYSLMANTIGNAQQRRNAALLQKTTRSVSSLTDAFRHFTTCHWIFDVSRSQQLMNGLPEEERSVFFFNISEIDWENYFRFFCYGMQRYVLNEEVRPPTEILKIDLVQEHRRMPEEKASFLRRMFPDTAWAFSRKYHQNVGLDNLNTLRTPDETKALILKSKRVRDAIQRMATEEEIEISEMEKRAKDILDRMAHSLTLKIVRTLGLFLRKVWRRIYQGLHVEEKGMDRIRAALRNGPLLLIPTHRSYVDFLLISYIMYEYDLPLPHIAAGEDFLGIVFVNWVFRNSGAFFLKRSFKNDPLYAAIFTEYVQRLIKDWSPVEFFIEGRRSRTGKSLHPKFGLLNICMEPLLNKKVPDLTVVPISISYEKVIEAELYTNELLGEQKTKESLKGLLSASKILQMNFGRINIICNEPISVKQYIADYSQNIQNNSNNNNNNNNATVVPFDPVKNEEDRKNVTSALAYTIARSLNAGLVITTTALVATVVLTYRKGLPHEELVAKVNWLREDVTLRGGSVAYEGTTAALVDSGLALLSNVVSKVRGHYVPSTSVETGKQNQSILVLDYYRNQLLHLYAEDGVIACVLMGLLDSKNGSSSAGVPRADLIKEAQFVKELLWLEFLNEPSMNIESKLNVTLDSMIKRGILQSNSNGSIQVTFNGEGPIHFLSYMYWPLVESYWVSAISLVSIQPNLRIPKRQLVNRMQWIAEKMFLEGKIHFYESCSMEVLSNTLDLWQNWKLVQITDGNQAEGQTAAAKRRRMRRERVSPPENPLVALLPPYETEESLRGLIEHVARFRKPTVHPNNYTNNASSLRSAVITDFPVLAKL